MVVIGMKATESKKRMASMIQYAPCFDINEIKVGECLGKGAFSKVYAINEIRINHCQKQQKIKGKKKEKKTKSMFSVFSSSSISPSESQSSAIEINVLPTQLLSSNEYRNGKEGGIIKKKNKRKQKNLIDNKYAMKMLRNKTLRREQKYADGANNDMMNELQILSSIVNGHKNIINVYGFGIAQNNGGKTFLIIDQLDCTLWNKMREWKNYSNHIDGDNQCKEKKNNALCDGNDTNRAGSSLEEKLSIALQIADALQYIHSRGCIHRDIKPENIGLMKNSDHCSIDQVKLIDFGSCRKLPFSTLCNNNSNIRGQIQTSYNNEGDELYHMTTVGTVLYMAPEVLKKERYNQKVDVYGWSLVVYAMLQSKSEPFPYYGEKNHIQVVCKENGFRPNFCGNGDKDGFIPQEIQDIVQCSWEHDVSKRYSITKAYNELDRYCIKIFQNQKHSHCFTKKHHHQQAAIMQPPQRQRKAVLSLQQKATNGQKKLRRYLSTACDSLIENITQKLAQQEDHQMESTTCHSISSSHDDYLCHIPEYTSDITT